MKPLAMTWMMSPARVPGTGAAVGAVQRSGSASDVVDGGRHTPWPAGSFDESVLMPLWLDNPARPEARPEASGALDTDLLVVGGGARGGTWRDVVARLSGRPVVVPAAEELVALGAAAQAAALLTDEPPDAVARRWGTRDGIVLDPVEVAE